MNPIRTLIMGAAGRDFHNFNVFFRDNPAYQVVAFTATQIPNIDDRKYPAALAGNALSGWDRYSSGKRTGATDQGSECRRSGFCL